MVRILRLMLIFVPIAVVAEFFIHNDLLIFASSAIALVPLAGVLGEPDLALGDARIEWADGGVVRDRARIEAAVLDALGLSA